MRKIIVLLLAFVMLSCNNKEGYKITIEMKDLAGATVVLRQNIDQDLVTIDSVVLDSTGTGEMSGVIEVPEMMYLGQQGTRQNLQIFMDNFNYSVNGTLNDVNIDADGGPQVEYNTYKEGAKEYNVQQQQILEVYYRALEDSVSRDSLQVILEPYYAINQQKMEYDSVFMAENSSNAITLFLLRSKFHSMDVETLEKWLSNFESPLHGTSYYSFLNNHLEKMKSVEIGDSYIDFELPDTDGNPLKLSDLVGNGPLLIDFWASWCGPCRAANPGVVEIYNEYHEQGFDIVGVSLDRTKEEWLKGIEEDNLTWHHMSDLQFWNSSAADLYAVKSIPHTVLLDENGTIVARNLSKEELKAKLQEML
jgi:peroxiredoxin